MQLHTQNDYVQEIEINSIVFTLYIQDISGGIVNTLGGGSMDYSSVHLVYTGCFRRNSKYFRRW